MVKILVVEDNTQLNSVICSFLSQNGYETKGHISSAANSLMCEQHFDLIIFDSSEKNIDEFNVIKNVRKLNDGVPILFMTESFDFDAKKRSFRIGIDDYMIKPIDLDELLLRVETLLIQTRITKSHKIEMDGFIMDSDKHTVSVNNSRVSMTIREFDILYKLLSHPKKTFTRRQLMSELWDADSLSSPRTVDVYINKIRKRLMDCKVFEIVTVHGLGYKAVPCMNNLP